MSKLTFQGKYGKGNPKRGKGFYIALSICFVVFTAAALLTYNGLKEFMTEDAPEESVIHSMQIPTQKTEEPEKEATSKFFEKDLEENNDDYISNIEYDTNPQTAIATKAETAGVIVNPTEQKEIIKKYSNGNLVYSKTLNDWRAHNGIDIKAEQGSKVKAITDGTVREIYDDSLLGQTIVIEHDGDFFAYYSGLGNTTLVNINDKVTAGQDIGSINDLPCEKADGYHLHLAIKKDDSFIDPLEILVDLA
ncbi:MAG: M23 family metallopeptidase [Clostridia bacterium]|nr:M23 family metallopeptidase [Clostridia bacterium]